MRKRTTKQIVIRIAIAGALLIALIVAGTILRMRTYGGTFFVAMGDFLKRTFTIGA